MGHECSYVFCSVFCGLGVCVWVWVIAPAGPLSSTNQVLARSYHLPLIYRFHVCVRWYLNLCGSGLMRGWLMGWW